MHSVLDGWGRNIMAILNVNHLHEWNFARSKRLVCGVCVPAAYLQYLCVDIKLLVYQHNQTYSKCFVQVQDKCHARHHHACSMHMHIICGRYFVAYQKAQTFISSALICCRHHHVFLSKHIFPQNQVLAPPMTCHLTSERLGAILLIFPLQFQMSSLKVLTELHRHCNAMV